MHIALEMKDHSFNINTCSPRVNCKVFEDNSDALEMTNLQKYRPRPKNIAVKLHQFCSYVKNGYITVKKINTKNQPINFLIKPLPDFELIKFCKIIMRC